MNTLIAEEFEFNYVIKSMDIEQGTIVVEYSPTNLSLLPITLNCHFNDRPLQTYPVGTYATQAEVPFADSLDYVVKQCAPIMNWRRHMSLLNNIDAVQSKMSATDWASTAPVLPWTKKEFLLKFTPTEYGAVKNAAAANNDVDYYWALFSNSENIVKTDPVFVTGINLLEAAGLIALGRAAQILA